MSREHRFDWVELFLVVAAATVIGVVQAAALAKWTQLDGDARVEMTKPAETQDLGPIFRCSGAGAEVLVSLGGDGKSIYWWCSEVKS